MDATFPLPPHNSLWKEAPMPSSDQHCVQFQIFSSTDWPRTRSRDQFWRWCWRVCLMSAWTRSEDFRSWWSEGWKRGGGGRCRRQTPGRLDVGDCKGSCLGTLRWTLNIAGNWERSCPNLSALDWTASSEASFWWVRRAGHLLAGDMSPSTLCWAPVVVVSVGFCLNSPWCWICFLGSWGFWRWPSFRVAVHVPLVLYLFSNQFFEHLKKSYKMLFSTAHLKELKIGRCIVKHEFRDQILK